MALAGWAVLAYLTIQFGGAFLWVLIGPFYLVVLDAKLVMKCMPTKREQASLRLMWLGPAVFLATLPLHIHRFNAARDAANQFVEAAERYRGLHGVYPPTEEAMNLDPTIKRTRFLYYDGKDGKPSLFYASPLIVFDTYQFDFDRKLWVYRAY